MIRPIQAWCGQRRRAWSAALRLTVGLTAARISSFLPLSRTTNRTTKEGLIVWGRTAFWGGAEVPAMSSARIAEGLRGGWGPSSGSRTDWETGRAALLAGISLTCEVTAVIICQPDGGGLMGRAAAGRPLRGSVGCAAQGLENQLRPRMRCKGSLWLSLRD